MSARKFRFVSPGIFLNEIDRSQITSTPENIGPIIIGRTEKGPGMAPTKIRSFSEFVETFGNPIAGIGGPIDVWREGNYSAPTYAAYAAQAYLRSGAGPITFLRLMGTQSPNAASTGGQAADGTGYAGWTTIKAPNPEIKSNGGAYGLFLFNSGAVNYGAPAACTNAGALGAIFYVNSGSVPVLKGTGTSGTANLSGTATVLKSDAAGNFTIQIMGGTGGQVIEDKGTFNLTEGSSNFIRKVFNTNPQMVNTTIENTEVTKSYSLKISRLPILMITIV